MVSVREENAKAKKHKINKNEKQTETKNGSRLKRT